MQLASETIAVALRHPKDYDILVVQGSMGMGDLDEACRKANLMYQFSPEAILQVLGTSSVETKCCPDSNSTGAGDTWSKLV